MAVAEVRADEIKTRAAQLTDQLSAATAQNSKLQKTVTEMQQAKNKKLSNDWFAHQRQGALSQRLTLKTARGGGGVAGRWPSGRPLPKTDARRCAGE